MNGQLIKAIQRENRLHPGTPVLLSDLRRCVPMSEDDFNAAVVNLAQSGKYFLSRNAKSPGSLSDAEKMAMVPDGRGRFYDSISPREPAAVEVMEDIEPVAIPDEPVKHVRGGQRSGAGRPIKKLKEKRLPLTGVRLPGWLLDKLQSEKDCGKKIETALIFYYGWVQPGRNDEPCCTDPGSDKG